MPKPLFLLILVLPLLLAVSCDPLAPLDQETPASQQPTTAAEVPKPDCHHPGEFSGYGSDDRRIMACLSDIHDQNDVIIGQNAEIIDLLKQVAANTAPAATDP